MAAGSSLLRMLSPIWRPAIHNRDCPSLWGIGLACDCPTGTNSVMSWEALNLLVNKLKNDVEQVMKTQGQPLVPQDAPPQRRKKTKGKKSLRAARHVP